MSSEPPKPIAETLIGTLPTAPRQTADDACSLPTVPGYEILGEIGRGGMGVVYRAKHLSLNRIVAIKMLPVGHMPGEVLFRFQKEAESLANLQHPNIVQIHEVGDYNGRPYFAMELVPGGSLSHFLARKPQPIRSAAEMTESLARAVQHAHERGIIHRDLKPGNILLSAELGTRNSERKTKSSESALRDPSSALRVAKITDFGLAKSLTAPDGPTQAGDILGTPSYMAPEQAGGVTKTLTTSVDVYALGAILYEMLTGSPPFLGADSTATVLQVLSQEPVAVRQLRPDCPRDLETICLKCLEKSPAKRYPAAAELADDLRRFLDNEPILARPAGPMERLGKWTKRNPALAALFGGATLAAIALVTLGVIYAAQLRKHNHELSAAVERERKAREQAQANFQIARQTVKDLLAEVATKDLESVPYMDPVRKALLEKAVKSQQAFLQQDRENPAVKRDLAQVMGDIGEIYELLGDKKQAELFMNDSITLHGELAVAFPVEPRHRQELALAQMRLANLMADSGETAAADMLFTDGLEQMRRLTSEHPDEAEYAFDMNRIRLNRANLYAMSGRTALAEAEYRQTALELAPLSESHAAIPAYRERLATAHTNLAQLLHDTDRFGDSAREYSAGIEIYDELSKKYPDQRRYRFELALSARSLGNAYWWLTPNKNRQINVKLLKDAEAAFRLSVDTFHGLADAFPATPDYRHSLALSIEAYGEFLYFEKKPGGLDRYKEALDLKEKLIAEFPNHPGYLGSIGMSCGMRGAAYRNEKDWKSALPWEEKSIAYYRAALKVSPTHPRVQRFLRNELHRYADTLLELKDPERAAAATTEAADRSQKNPEDLFRSACSLAGCAVLDSDAKRKGDYADRAMDFLRQSLKAGFNDMKQLNESPELELLRKRPDWKSLPIPATPAIPPSKPSPPS